MGEIGHFKFTNIHHLHQWVTEWHGRVKFLKR